MSGHHVSDMAMSFVEMAKAFEELPKVKAELAEANRAFNHASDTIQRLELKLIDRNTTIDELHAKVREAEVARDDAELRFLEADDKLGRVAKAIAAASEVVRVADPVNASAASQEEPTAERPLDDAPTTTEHGSDVSSSAATVEHGQETLSGSTQGEPAVPPEPFSPESKPTDQVEVREEANPTVQLDSTQSTTVSSETAAMVETALPETAASGQSDPLPTAESPIDGSTAGNTNANPSGDASSPIDEIDAVSYTNEPQDKWTAAWSEWAVKMDRKHGRYNWPLRTAQA